MQPSTTSRICYFFPLTGSPLPGHTSNSRDGPSSNNYWKWRKPIPEDLCRGGPTGAFRSSIISEHTPPSSPLGRERWSRLRMEGPLKHDDPVGLTPQETGLTLQPGFSFLLDLCQGDSPALCRKPKQSPRRLSRTVERERLSHNMLFRGWDLQ